MFYLTKHSTHFIYGYMVSDIWLRTILIVRKETSCRHIGYSYRLTARVLLYAPSHRQENTYHGLCYTSRGALAGTRTSRMGSGNEMDRRYVIFHRTRLTLLKQEMITVLTGMWWKEGRSEQNVIFNDTLKTFYSLLYGVGDTEKNNSDSERG